MSRACSDLVAFSKTTESGARWHPQITHASARMHAHADGDAAKGLSSTSQRMDLIVLLKITFKLIGPLFRKPETGGKP